MPAPTAQLHNCHMNNNHKLVPAMLQHKQTVHNGSVYGLEVRAQSRAQYPKQIAYNVACGLHVARAPPKPKAPIDLALTI